MVPKMCDNSTFSFILVANRYFRKSDYLVRCTPGTCRWVLIAFVSLVIFATPRRGNSDELAQIAEAGEQWIIGWREEAEKLGDFLVASYSIDAESEEAVRSFLTHRIVEQYYFEQGNEKRMAEFQSLAESGAMIEGSEAADAAARFLETNYESMPLNPNAVADWLESTIPVGNPGEGRARYKELLAYEGLSKVAEESFKVRQVGIGRSIRMASVKSIRPASSVIGDSRVESTTEIRDSQKHYESLAVPPAFMERWRIWAANKGSTMGIAPDLKLFEIWQNHIKRASDSLRMANEPISRRLAINSSKIEAERLIDQAGFRATADALFVEFQQRVDAYSKTLRSNTEFGSATSPSD